MIDHFFAIVLAWMSFLAPGRDHNELAWAVAAVASSESEAAEITAVAFRESSLRNNMVGDHGKSVCAMQIHGGARSLLDDPGACVRRGVTMLRESKRRDPANPIAFYARGPRYQGEEARRISRDRMALARRLLALPLQLADVPIDCHRSALTELDQVERGALFTPSQDLAQP